MTRVSNAIGRRSFLTGAGALVVTMTLSLARVSAAAAEELTPVKLPSPITPAERAQRLIQAKTLG